VIGTGALFAQEQPPFELPPGVELKAGVVYASAGPSRDLRLDLYLPKTRAARVPGVVYIHGGGWSGGNRNAFRRQAAYMAARGFVGACIEYRLSGEAIWPAAMNDSKAAVRWLRAHAAEYSVDPGRIGAAGGSAGGHLAAMLGTTAGLEALEGGGGNPGVSSAVQAVAAFNPAVDLVSFGKAQPGNAASSVAKFLGATYAEKPEIWELATPLHHAGKRSAPTLFLHGDKDTLVPYQQSLDMHRKLKAAGVETELYTGEGGAHGFFNRPPYFEPTLKKMEEFFTRVLAGKPAR
jgi:pectinesterase